MFSRLLRAVGCFKDFAANEVIMINFALTLSCTGSIDVSVCFTWVSIMCRLLSIEY